MLGLGQVMKSGARSNNGKFEIFNSESFQRSNPEMLYQQFIREIRSKNPIVEGVNVKFTAKQFGEFLFFVFLDDDFARPEALYQFINDSLLPCAR